MARLQVVVDDDVAARVRVAAEVEGRSVSSWCALVLRGALEGERALGAVPERAPLRKRPVVVEPVFK